MVSEGEWVTKRLNGLCRVSGCDRNHGDKKALCLKHDAEVWRHRHPLEASYKWLLSSARKRKIPMLLTLEQFKQVIDGTGYLEMRGREMDSLQLDRKDPKGPYEVGNVRVITKFENLARRGLGTSDISVITIPSSDSWLYEEENEDDPF